jgi:hypothetical protein
MQPKLSQIAFYFTLNEVFNVQSTDILISTKVPLKTKLKTSF